MFFKPEHARDSVIGLGAVVEMRITAEAPITARNLLLSEIQVMYLSVKIVGRAQEHDGASYSFQIGRIALTQLLNHVALLPVADAST